MFSYIISLHSLLLLLILFTHTYWMGQSWDILIQTTMQLLIVAFGILLLIHWANSESQSPFRSTKYLLMERKPKEREIVRQTERGGEIQVLWWVFPFNSRQHMKNAPKNAIFSIPVKGA